MSTDNFADCEIARQIKEELCYTALDWQKELDTFSTCMPNSLPVLYRRPAAWAFLTATASSNKLSLASVHVLTHHLIGMICDRVRTETRGCYPGLPSAVCSA